MRCGAAEVAAIDQGTPVGAVISCGRRNQETDGHWHTIHPGWISALFVKLDHRRQGIARRLLKRAEAYHEERGRLLLFAGGGEGYDNPFPGIEFPPSWNQRREAFRPLNTRKDSGCIPLRL